MAEDDNTVTSDPDDNSSGVVEKEKEDDDEPESAANNVSVKGNIVYMWTNEALTINKDVDGYYGYDKDRSWYFMRYKDDPLCQLRGVRRDFFRLSGAHEGWIERCHEQGLPVKNRKGRSYKRLSGGSLDSTDERKGCIGACDIVVSSHNMCPGADPWKSFYLFQSPPDNPLGGFCVRNALLTVTQHLLSSDQVKRVPNLITLDGFNNWLDQHKLGGFRLSKRLRGGPGTYPPTGRHIVFDTRNVHHDSVYIRSDGTLEFYTTNSSVSASVLSNTHEYVANFFNHTYGYRTVIEVKQSHKRKRKRRGAKKKKRKKNPRR